MRMSRYLQHIYVERFGGLSHRAVGPFGQGLNVVYGPNEAGKSTLNALVRGVLFGWEDAHGVRNTYRPPTGERSGALVWEGGEGGEGGEGDGSRVASAASIPTASAPVMRLERDESGVAGDVSVTDDIDRETFDAVFSFSSHDLHSLGNSSDVTARLLTAVSGTGSSPAGAFVEIERRIADTTQRILELGEQLESARERVRQTGDSVELWKQEDRELRDITAGRELVAEKIDQANDELEDLIAWRAELEALDARVSGLRAELDSLEAERVSISSRSEKGRSMLDNRLLELDSAEERVLRDSLDEYAEAQEKTERMLDTAKENSATSNAAYEALEELGAGETARKSASPQVIVSIILPVAFIAAGVPLFMYGRQIASLSFTALGIGLVLFAVILAAVAVVVLMRPPKSESALESRRQDAQWVMLQDRKKLDACLAEKGRLAEEVAKFLAESGLAAAGGSVRQARSLLDEARAERAEIASYGQRLSSLEMRIGSARQELSLAERRKRRIADEAGLWPGPQPGLQPMTQPGMRQGLQTATQPGMRQGLQQGLQPSLQQDFQPEQHDASARDFDALIRRRTAQRDALIESSENMSQRFGELTRELEQAKYDMSFTMAKYEAYRIRAQLRTEKHRLVELLLAKRMLERAIATWEGLSQPAVYDHASRLLALITDGAWVRVTTSATGSLVAVNSDGEERDPRHLSLGTCQQLYLALRIALLLESPDVGRDIPVLADDILVHFDATKRVGAARALAELARSRQVIVFTCHRETADALAQADSTLALINLQDVSRTG